jgi:PAS domain S-box-containing protein
MRNTSEYLEKLFTYANAPIIVWDVSFKITRFNRAFERMTGHSAAEVVGKDLSVLFPSGSREGSLELITRTLSGERWESVEIPILRSDGTIRIALWNSANIYEKDGKTLTATIAQGQDITERKEAEAALKESIGAVSEEKRRLQFIIDSLPVAVGLYDSKGRRVLANSKVDIIWHGEMLASESHADFGEYLGYDSKTGVLLKPNEWPIPKVLETGEPVLNQEIDILRLDKTPATILASAVPMTDEYGRTAGALIAYIDITAQKSVEKELARSNTELQSFAYAASHDLREPLRTISGFLEILSMDYGDKLDVEAKEHIRRAVNASTRLHVMIDDILSYSRLETRKKPVRLVKLDDVLAEALVDLNKTLPEHKATVTSDPLPTVWADDQQMAIVFRNLIDNGIKFHRKEPPKVQITARRKGDEWIIRFEDNGIGIDEKYYGKVFDMFTRLHSRAEYPGTGIGLAMCKKIIERHGGHIWVESHEGKGSAFYFTIRDLHMKAHQNADIESWAGSGASELGKQPTEGTQSETAPDRR